MLMREILQQVKTVPEYLLALKSALVVLALALPVYLALRYFLYRRRLSISLGVTFNFFGAFILFAGLAFLLASPLASYLPGSSITAYLFVTCLAAALGVVAWIDVFMIQYYLVQVQRVYISPPLRVVIKLSVFLIALLPILRFVLHFNPLAIVAIPTIATAGIALALQDTLKTFIAGVGLGHIIRLGEWISFEGREGQVIGINWARTVVETTDGQRIFIPNTLLQTGVFANLTAGNPENRQLFKIGVACDAPPERVKEVLIRAVESVPGLVQTQAPKAIVLEYAESSVVYGIYYWISDIKLKLQAQDEVASRVWYAFKREGIQIPYPVRIVQVERRRDFARREQVWIQKELQRWTLAEAFYNEELEDLSQSTRVGLYAPGELIVRKGEPGESLFAIVEGQVDVLSDDPETVIATLGPRDIFGEMSLLTGAARSATVRARSAVEVLEVNKPGMQKLISKRPELSDRLATLVQTRQTQLAQTAGNASRASVSATEPAESLGKKIRVFFGLA